jgi:gas vesicle protein
MYDDDRINGTHVLLAFLAGAVVGAVVAALSAPESGPETRHRIKSWASDAQERVPRAVRGAYTRAASAARKAFADSLERETPSS